VTVKAAFGYSRQDYEDTIALMQRGTLKTEPVITSVVPASEAHLAFERLLTPGADVKVLVDPRR
jgi:threonine dehydrogenase-like Zn-dependent dehydrogenase